MADGAAMVCRWCGETQHKGICPRVKSMEFFPDGGLSRVEFMTPGDLTPPYHHHDHLLAKPPQYGFGPAT